MTTRPQTDDVIRLTSLSIHHVAGVDMSDSPALASLAGTGPHVCHIFLPAFFYYASRTSPPLLGARGHLRGERTDGGPADWSRYLMSYTFQLPVRTGVAQNFHSGAKYRTHFGFPVKKSMQHKL